MTYGAGLSLNTALGNSSGLLFTDVSGNATNIPGTYIPGYPANTVLTQVASTATGAPTILNLSPSSGSVNTTVTITGTGFTATGNTVNFGSGIGIPNLSSSNSTSLTFIVPSRGAFPNCPNNAMCAAPPILLGSYAVTVTNANGTSNATTFTVTSSATVSAPTISNLSPISGPVGTTITITGSGFTSSGNSVSMKGFLVGDNLASGDGNTLQFTLPVTLAPHCSAGMACPQFIIAVTAGDYPVIVTNANGTSNSQTFSVTGNYCASQIECAAPPTGYYYQRAVGSCDCGALTPLSNQ